MVDEMPQDDLIRLLDDLCDGNLSPDDERRLAARICTDPDACLVYVRYLDMHASLGQVCHVDELTRGATESFTRFGGDATAVFDADGMPLPKRPELLTRIVERSFAVFADPVSPSLTKRHVDDCDSHERLRVGVRSLAPILSLLLIGAFAISGITWRTASWWFGKGQGVAAAPQEFAGAAPSRNAHVATLVNVTNCRWDRARSTAELSPGGVVRSGESLHLREGVAEIKSTLKNGGMASLQLEGPLAMTLNSQGMPSLLYGHLTGSFACDYDQFTLDTPLGQVSVSGDASIGIVAAANKVELHVFSGAATLELWAMGFGGAAKQLNAAAGTALSARVDADGNVSVDHGQATETGFITPAALTASRLHISNEYVATILAAKPAAYWRFEGDDSGLMRNEMGDRLHCRMMGKAVRWHPGHDGSTIEFGTTAGPGYLISDDTLDQSIESYTIELWAKPTYFHHGTLFSLIQWSAPQSPIGKHRMALEICGPAAWLMNPYQITDYNPGRMRFVHECRPGFDMDCFSNQPYAVRQWQHFVAVKAPAEMRLYLNGRLVDSKAATGSPLSSGPRVLMGQLLPVSPQIADEVTPRLFSGELDEVAFYERVVSEEEIRRHFKLARPDVEPADTVKVDGI